MKMKEELSMLKEDNNALLDIASELSKIITTSTKTNDIDLLKSSKTSQLLDQIHKIAMKKIQSNLNLLIKIAENNETVNTRKRTMEKETAPQAKKSKSDIPDQAPMEDSSPKDMEDSNSEDMEDSSSNDMEDSSSNDMESTSSEADTDED